MELSRRGMLRGTVGAAMAIGTAVAVPGTASAAETISGRGRRVPRDRISIQLYTLRTLLADDLEGTLSSLADIGYRKVELAGTYGRGAAEFRSILDSKGLAASSSHIGIDGDVNKLIEDAHTLGHTYLVVPYVNYPTIAQWQEFARRLDEAGRACRRAGLRLGYHNHAHEFALVEGRRPFDVLVEGTSPRNVHLEVDLFWAVEGGVDPVRVVHANRGRVLQYHVKDRAPDGRMVDLGTGAIDFGHIFRRTWGDGPREYIVEHDQPADPLNTALVGYRYLTNLRF